MGLAPVHAVARNGTSHSTDEDDRSVWLDPLDDADVCQRIIELTIPVEIPGVIKEHQITWAYVRALMKNAMLADMVVDEPDAVCVHFNEIASIQVDTVLQEDGTRDSCAVIVDAPTLDGDTF
jgi:hypothetical protein